MSSSQQTESELNRGIRERAFTVPWTAKISTFLVLIVGGPLLVPWFGLHERNKLATRAHEQDAAKFAAGLTAGLDEAINPPRLEPGLNKIQVPGSLRGCTLGKELGKRVFRASSGRQKSEY